MYPISEYIGSFPSKLRKISASKSTSLEKENPNVQSINVKSKNNDQNQGKNLLKSDIYLALMPLYYVSKVCGHFPVEIKSRGGGIYSVKLNILAVIYGILLATTFIAAQAWGLWRELRNGWQNSTRLSSQAELTVTCTDVIGMVTVMLTIIFNAPFRWQYLQKAIKILAEIDEKIGILELKRLQRISIVLIFGPLLYLILLFLLDFKAWKLSDNRKSQLLSDKGQINYVPIYFMYIVITVFESQYALVTFNVGERFSRLNVYSKKILKCNKLLEVAPEFKQQDYLFTVPRITSDLNENNKTKRYEGIVSGSGNQTLINSISTLATLHGELCDSTTFVNIAYGVPLLTCVLGCMLHLINSYYYLYIKIKEQDYSGLFLVTQPLWVIFHIVMLLVLVQPCYMAILKSRDTTLLVSQLLTLKWNPDVQKKLEIFSLQLLHRPLDFSACGLFSIDRGLVTSIAGAVATYLVILVQFQNQNDCSQGTKDLKNATDMLIKNLSLAKVPKS